MASKKTALPVLNLAETTYECIYGRGCDGICCQNGRPPVSPEEKARIDAHLPRFLAELTAKQRRAIEKGGYLSQRIKSGKPMLRVLDGWCIFFNQGCVLHKIGMMEGDSFKYKPVVCVVFPLDVDTKGRWYVRQWGVDREEWDLFCLNPRASPMPAAESLKVELALVEQVGVVKQEGSVR